MIVIYTPHLFRPFLLTFSVHLWQLLTICIVWQSSKEQHFLLLQGNKKARSATISLIQLEGGGGEAEARGRVHSRSGWFLHQSTQHFHMCRVFRLSNSNMLCNFQIFIIYDFFLWDVPENEPIHWKLLLYLKNYSDCRIAQSLITGGSDARWTRLYFLTCFTNR